MTESQIIKKVKSIKPVSVECLRKNKIYHRYLKCGTFRAVYDLLGTDAVIKFPYGDTDIGKEESLFHAIREIQVYNRIKKSKRDARKKYLPRVFYADQKNGVIIMRKYKVVKQSMIRKSKKMYEEIEKIMYAFPQDGGCYNTGVDEKGRMIILDLGLE